MFTPSRHLIQPLECPRVRVCPILAGHFVGFVKFITVRYLIFSFSYCQVLDNGTVANYLKGVFLL